MREIRYLVFHMKYKVNKMYVLFRNYRVFYVCFRLLRKRIKIFFIVYDKYITYSQKPPNVVSQINGTVLYVNKARMI